jgi:hypothetical protein
MPTSLTGLFQRIAMQLQEKHWNARDLSLGYRLYGFLAGVRGYLKYLNANDKRDN